ncbi:DEAD/DEAH box helicase [Corynebacterium gerontici]|uniref:ATP-dependent helicase HepA n=1 Tax=Corynebacterium gerontici TaxID=2079234 RepID=A0A3G6IZS5_9CORY|nr:DEAD/DEAH box helicase [Corynebacterium gerontici]AZA11202.1 ATP-dependent helicase HepA [Corynebacterium gerontici]
MPEYLLHGLWSNDVGLMLWIEQSEGHKILTRDAVPREAFPPVVWQVLESKRLTHFQPVTLLTPKGRTVNISKLPTLAFYPEQAVGIFELLSTINALSATSVQRQALAPDLQWLIRMYQGLLTFVRAGRVSIRMAFRDQLWWPQWVLSSGLNERGWIAQMLAAAPGVLVRNAGETVAEDIAEVMTHWIANHLLADLAEAPRPHDWHAFSRALLRSEPLQRANPKLLGALGKWRNSVSTANLSLVVLIEEPEEEDGEQRDVNNLLWPVKIMMRSGVEAPQPIVLRQCDRAMVEALRESHNKLLKIAPILDYRRDLPPGVVPVWSEDALGDWDSVLTTEELAHFVRNEVQALSKGGFTIMLPKVWSAKKEHTRIKVEIGGPLISRFGLDQIVEYDWKVSVGSTELTEEQMRSLVRSKSGLLLLDGKWVVADPAQVRQVEAYLEQLEGQSQHRLRKRADEARMRAELAALRDDPRAEALAAEAADLAALADDPESSLTTISDLRELALDEEHEELVEYEGDPWYQQLLGVLDGEAAPAPQRVAIPPTVRAELREYQRRGVDWLHWMANNGVGAVLADDMGLGKTLQVLALEAIERADGQAEPTLVVAPTSVVGNWAAEAARFVPHLRVLVLHGAKRPKGEDLLAAVAAADLVVSSYGVLQRDAEDLAGVHWWRVVLDEAQAIKNAHTKASKAARSLPSTHRLALTGTPIENKLAELHSILDFVNRGVLGTASSFRNNFARAIERYNDEAASARLKRLSAPFILRRLKSDPSIIDDLPEKNEHIIPVQLTPEQAALYEAFVHGVADQLHNAPGLKDIEKKGKVLMAITKIKQICNHPAHFLGDHSPMTHKGRHRSGKVAKLMEILSDAQLDGEKVLIFTQYTAFGHMLVPYVREFFGLDIPFLHGGVSKAGRDRMVKQFQSEQGPPVMVLSLKAGGTGLNLTAANVVVHMDRWWNPAVENQATDRAYRIGQGRDVRVYKLMTTGTLEESINEVINGKIALANAVVGAGEGWLTELEPEQLLELMRLRKGAVDGEGA